ncbi:unnamed protein product [Tetraodon nigroviridis]|uniref:(spotted green pufferfish) hypothetical protein n=1 Tax=Tetraodon nigroviridis TaxID=99883 RepID=Q4STG5_TETNG|nr:unnamed protein product [Tetraodon nigroviridis]
MGIEEETDRTLFIRNLDARVTEELLFELFLQAGPLVKTRIPKDPEGRQKSFGFAVYKHEVSVPYAMQLLDGTPLFGRSLHVQFRSGSSHSSNAQKSPTDSLDPRGQRSPVQFHSPPYTPPPQIQRSHPSPDSLQKHAAVNARQHHMQQLSPRSTAASPLRCGRLPEGNRREGAPGSITSAPTSTQQAPAAGRRRTPTSSLRPPSAARLGRLSPAERQARRSSP